MPATDPFLLKPRTSLQSFSPFSTPYQNNIWDTTPQKKTSSDFFGTTPNAEDAFSQFRLPKIPGLDKIIEDRSKQIGEEGRLAAEDIAAYRAATKATQPESEEAQKSDA